MPIIVESEPEPGQATEGNVVMANTSVGQVPIDRLSTAIPRPSRVTGRHLVAVPPLTGPQRVVRYIRTTAIYASVAAVLYYGFGFGMAYMQYWQLVNEMQVDADVGTKLSEQALRGRLVAATVELGLPEASSRFQIKRLRVPSVLEISTH